MTVPPIGLVISLRIFIASRTSSTWPAATVSPSRTRTSTTLPGIGGSTGVPSPGGSIGSVETSARAEGAVAGRGEARPAASTLARTRNRSPSTDTESVGDATPGPHPSTTVLSPPISSSTRAGESAMTFTGKFR
ncbi:MAG: hypothetical protein L3J91_05765, partial [Thermoplasmata archaeon]|nr:hypothetical protein [Thermoplasmata archaeon]